MSWVAGEYDSSSLQSVYRYAKRLEGTTLRDACDIDDIEDPSMRKGSLGNAIERFYFHYPINNDPNPDFAEIGTELKTTPLKLKKDGNYSAKERLVISMINYMSVIDETWETSSLQKKLQKLLIVAYQYDKDLNPVDYLIKLVELWGIPEEDAPIFKQDWDTVVSKIRRGFAHELSGSDTLYLEAATKASSSKDRRPQPFSSMLAKPRAWAIKSSYMTAVLNQMLGMQSIERAVGEKSLGLLDLVRKRFEPYFGLTEDDLAGVAGYHFEGKRKPKNICALITRHILGVEEHAKIAEFEKAGIKTKTIRLKRSGVPKESISFPTFSYLDVSHQKFEESDFYRQLHTKYLFVIYREDEKEGSVFRLEEVLFWQMPDGDLIEAKRCYEEMRRRINEGRADLSVRSSENRCCHVRPHARNKADTLPTPYGSRETKKCFWINASYIASEIDRVRRAKNAPVADIAWDSQDRSDVEQQTIRVAELFAGVGGFRLGLEGYRSKEHPEFNMPAAGPYATIWANQWEPPGTPQRQFAAACYRERFGSESVVNEDIHRVLDAYEDGSIDIPDVDMVVGGFPCQDYSVAKPLSQANGIEGKKGVLWWDIYRFLQLKSPRYALLENVDRLLKSPVGQRGRDFAIILSCFAALGYAVEWRVINGADYGFAQKRRRTYIYAEKSGESWNLAKRLTGGVMAEAFPAAIAGEVHDVILFDDPYENTKRFGVGLKQSPFLTAGAMQVGNVVTARVAPTYDGSHQTLGDVLVPEEEVPADFFVEQEKLDKWVYFKGGKSEPRVDKKTGFAYRYAEGSMAFPDPVDGPARTILTSEGGGLLPERNISSPPREGAIAA